MKISRRQLKRLIKEAININNDDFRSLRAAINEAGQMYEWPDLIEVMNKQYPNSSEVLHITSPDEMRSATLDDVIDTEFMFMTLPGTTGYPEAKRKVESYRRHPGRFLDHLGKLYEKGYIKFDGQAISDLTSALEEVFPDAFESPAE